MSDADRRARGAAAYDAVYGGALPKLEGDVPDLPSDFFALTLDTVFADVWSRPGLSQRDRRLLIIGVIAALGEEATLAVQFKAALAQGELDVDAVREVILQLTPYVGWPRGAKAYGISERCIAEHEPS